MINMDKQRINRIASACLERWDAEDKKTLFFSENYEEWFEQLPEEIRPTALVLLSKFEYYSQPKINALLVELHQRLIRFEGFDLSKTLFTHLPSKKGIENSSIDYLMEYRRLHDLSKYHVIMDLDTYASKKSTQFESIENVVFIDDYCGSGDTYNTYLRDNCDKLKGKRLFYVVTYTMQEAIPRIYDTARELGIQQEIVYINSGEKAFSNEQFGETGELEREKMKKASRKLQLKKRSYLGYEDTEAVVSFYNDTPNNTIGIFWCDSPIFFSIFPREMEEEKEHKRPTPREMKKEKQKRDQQNYETSTWSVKSE